MTTVFGTYRRTTAHWKEGVVCTVYVKQKGQGSLILLEEFPEKEPLALGGLYGLSLTEIAEGAPIPPIEMPTPPDLPEVKPTPPIYYPVTPEHPIYKPEYPYEKPTPPIYEKPTPPIGVEPPIYEKPEGKPEPK